MIDIKTGIRLMDLLQLLKLMICMQHLKMARGSMCVLATNLALCHLFIPLAFVS